MLRYVAISVGLTTGEAVGIVIGLLFAAALGSTGIAYWFSRKGYCISELKTRSTSLTDVMSENSFDGRQRRPMSSLSLTSSGNNSSTIDLVAKQQPSNHKTRFDKSASSKGFSRNYLYSSMRGMVRSIKGRFNMDNKQPVKRRRKGINSGLGTATSYSKSMAQQQVNLSASATRNGCHGSTLDVNIKFGQKLPPSMADLTRSQLSLNDSRNILGSHMSLNINGNLTRSQPYLADSKNVLPGSQQSLPGHQRSLNEGKTLNTSRSALPPYGQLASNEMARTGAISSSSRASSCHQIPDRLTNNNNSSGGYAIRKPEMHVSNSQRSLQPTVNRNTLLQTAVDRNTQLLPADDRNLSLQQVVNRNTSLQSAVDKNTFKGNQLSFPFKQSKNEEVNTAQLFYDRQKFQLPPDFTRNLSNNQNSTFNNNNNNSSNSHSNSNNNNSYNNSNNNTSNNYQNMSYKSPLQNPNDYYFSEPVNNRNTITNASNSSGPVVHRTSNPTQQSLSRGDDSRSNNSSFQFPDSLPQFRVTNKSEGRSRETLADEHNNSISRSKPKRTAINQPRQAYFNAIYEEKEPDEKRNFEYRSQARRQNDVPDTHQTRKEHMTEHLNISKTAISDATMLSMKRNNRFEVDNDRKRNNYNNGSSSYRNDNSAESSAKSSSDRNNTSAKSSSDCYDNSVKSSSDRVNASTRSSSDHNYISAKISSDRYDNSAKSSSDRNNISAKSSSERSNTNAKSSSDRFDNGAKSKSDRYNNNAKSSSDRNNTRAKSNSDRYNTSAESSSDCMTLPNNKQGSLYTLEVSNLSKLEPNNENSSEKGFFGNMSSNCGNSSLSLNSKNSKHSLRMTPI